MLSRPEPYEHERPNTGVWFFPDKAAPDLVSAIVLAEESGLDEAWVGDEGPAREPFAVLAAATQATERIRLAVGVTNPYVRHPGIAVTTMLTIHELSGGRAILGVGAGGAMSLAPFELTPVHPTAQIRRFLELAEAVRDGHRADGYQPTDLSIGPGVPPMPVFVGARGPRLNALASELADGAFIAGMPPFRYGEVIGWARSVRQISIALYPSVAFEKRDAERHRPEMIWSLLDTSDEVRAAVGVSTREVEDAAAALRLGDSGPARDLISAPMQEKLMLVGAPEVVGERLADLVRQHRPTSIGLALLQDDLLSGVTDAARAFDVMRHSLGGF